MIHEGVARSARDWLIHLTEQVPGNLGSPVDAAACEDKVDDIEEVRQVSHS